MIRALELTGSERAAFSLQLDAWLFRNPLAAFMPVLLLPVVFMIF